jgi:hypothetical protein
MARVIPRRGGAAGRRRPDVVPADPDVLQLCKQNDWSQLVDYLSTAPLPSTDRAIPKSEIGKQYSPELCKLFGGIRRLRRIDVHEGLWELTGRLFEFILRRAALDPDRPREYADCVLDWLYMMVECEEADPYCTGKMKGSKHRRPGHLERALKQLVAAQKKERRQANEAEWED